MLLPLCIAVSCDQIMEMIQTGPTVFEVSLTETQLNASHTETSVKVKCDFKWTAKLEDSSWGSITETTVWGDDGIVVISLGFNKDAASRSNTLTITSGKSSKSVDIRQGGLDDLIKPSSIQLRGTEASELSFLPGVDWKLATETGWIALPERTSGLAGIEAKLSVSANEEFIDLGTREGALTFTFGDKYTVAVPVTQYQTDAVILESTRLEADYKAQSLTMKVDSNTDYTVSTEASWVHRQSPCSTKALNVSEELFAIEENPTSATRTAVVTFTGGEGGKATAELTIVQEGYDSILDNRTCGVYGFGIDYQLQPNTMQTSRTLNGDGTYTYTLLLFTDMTVCRLSGLPVVQDDGSSCTLRLSVTRAGTSLLDRSAECVLVGQDDDLRWYRVSGGAQYFIIGNTIN